MVSIPATLLSSLVSYLRPTRTCKSGARVFSDTPSSSQAFEADLAASLQNLTHGESDLISFNWMCKALDVVISTQASVKQALRLHSTSFRSGKEMSKMMEQYMEDSVKMLDVCCLLKEALAGATAHVKASQLAVTRLQGLKLVHQGDIERAKHDFLSVQERVLGAGASVRTGVRDRQSTLKRLTACSSLLRRMGDKLTAPMSSSTESDLHLEEVNTASLVSSALHGGEMCTLFVLRVLSAALSSPARSPRRSSSFMTPLHMSGKAAWAPSLLSLQAQLNSEFAQIAKSRTNRCITLLPELHTLEANMNEICESLLQKRGRDIDLKHLVESTSKLIYNLQISMARLEQQIECIFSSLVDARMAMLDA